MADYSKMKVVELKAELKRLGLPQTGLKAELVSRLEVAASEGEPPAASAEAPSETESTAEADEVQPSDDVASAHETQEPQHQEPPQEPPQEPAQAPAQDHQSETSNGTIQHSPSRDDAKVQITSSTGLSETPSLATTELVQDVQKRKRRSTTPPPSAEIARKRPRQNDQEVSRDVPTLSYEALEPQNSVAREPSTADIEMAPVQDEPHAEKEPALEETDGLSSKEPSNGVNVTETMPPDENALLDRSGVGGAEDSLMAEPDTTSYERETYSATSETLGHAAHETKSDYLSPERDIEPSIHPATNALYIKDFMRPLKPQAVQEHLLELATPASSPIDHSIISNFYLDSIRTHAFAVFTSVSAASRVRTALHKRVWPDETNRKALWVDFMPPECFEDWVNTELQAKERGSMPRYEVVYDRDIDGNVVAKLEEVDASQPTKRGPASPVALLDGRTSIPTGPSRPSGIENAPTGPRNPYAHNGPGPMYQSRQDRQDRHDAGFIRTKSGPPVLYRPVPPELSQRRLDILAKAKDQLYDEESGRDYHRYYFERDIFLVDRGPEIFLGIRPPHREKERRELARNGGIDNRDRSFRDRRGPPGPPGGGGGGVGGVGGGGRRRRRAPRPHGVPRGGDRFRPPGSSYEDRFAPDDRRPPRYGGSSRRQDSHRY